MTLDPGKENKCFQTRDQFHHTQKNPKKSPLKERFIVKIHVKLIRTEAKIASDFLFAKVTVHGQPSGDGFGMSPFKTRHAHGMHTWVKHTNTPVIKANAAL